MAVMNRVRTVWTGVAGTPYYTNLYFTDDATNVTAQAAIDAVDAFWTGFRDYWANPLSYVVEGVVARIDDATGDLVGQWGLVQGVGNGGSTGELLPRQTQALVRWTTGAVAGSRLLRGRTFCPGMTETYNDTNGNPTSSILSAIQVAAQQLIDVSTCELLVWSRTHGTSSPVTGQSAWTQWGNQRSRRD